MKCKEAGGWTRTNVHLLYWIEALKGRMEAVPRSISNSYHNSSAMAGDVNIYINEFDDHPEIEVMIAEPSSRRKGLAKEALQVMMRYAIENLHHRAFLAKILDHNTPSLSLFRSLGYTETSHSDFFKTTTLSLELSEQEIQNLKSIPYEILIDDYVLPTLPEEENKR